MELTPRILASLGMIFLALGSIVLLNGAGSYYSGSLHAQKQRPVVILTFESRLDTNEDASLVARLTQALQQTVDDARTLPMRLGGVVKAQQVVVHPVAMQVGDSTSFHVTFPGIPPSHMGSIEALALGRPVGHTRAITTLPPTSHLTRRLDQQGITARRIMWQTLYVPAPPTLTAPMPSLDAYPDDDSTSSNRHTPQQQQQWVSTLLDDDVEQLALLHALERAGKRQPPLGYEESSRRAQHAKPVLVGGRAGTWPHPEDLPVQVLAAEDQELAASRQVVAGGAGSVLVSNPFPRSARDVVVYDDDEDDDDADKMGETMGHAPTVAALLQDIIMQRQPLPEDTTPDRMAALWHRIHKTWDDARQHPDASDSSSSTTRPVTTLDALPTNNHATTTTQHAAANHVEGVDIPLGIDLPLGIDRAAVDRVADWEIYPEEARVWPTLPRPIEPAAQPHGLLLFSHQGRLLLHKLRALLVGGGRGGDVEGGLVQRGRRLAEVNWPLTGTGIGLGGLGVILLSAAVGAICSRWCLARRERQAKKHDLHTRFPLGSHFYEVPSFLGGNGEHHQALHGGKPLAHQDVLAHQQAMLREAELARAGLYNGAGGGGKGGLTTPATFGKGQGGGAPGGPPSLARPSVCSVASAGHAGSVFSSFTAAPSMFGARAPQGPVMGTPETPESVRSMESAWHQMPAWAQEDPSRGIYTPRGYMSSAGGNSMAVPQSLGSQPPSRSMSPLRGMAPMAADAMSHVSGGTMEGSAVYYHHTPGSLVSGGRQGSFVGYAAGPAQPVVGSPAHSMLSLPTAGVAPVGRVFDPNASRPIFGTPPVAESSQGGSGVNISLASSQS